MLRSEGNFSYDMAWLYAGQFTSQELYEALAAESSGDGFAEMRIQWS
ncbi:MAG: hypothetical protein NZ960_04730 [Candidatus Kapabacteria bacterium]|nr:hypothetical protein [Candidatus Kapabacteria bacterium]MDW8012047.1 hypothetical protein [Bacteroidota bacterium]